MTINFGERVPLDRHADIRRFIRETVDKSTQLYRMAVSPRDSDFVFVIRDWSVNAVEPREHLTVEVYHVSRLTRSFTSQPLI